MLFHPPSPVAQLRSLGVPRPRQAASTEVAKHSEGLVSDRSPGRSCTELGFIDPSVPHFRVVALRLSDLWQVSILKAHWDGVLQIADALVQHTQIDILHVVATCETKTWQLGCSRLNLYTLEAYRQSFRGWGRALSDRATIVLHRETDFHTPAPSSDDRAFAARLCELTGAKVYVPSIPLDKFYLQTCQLS